MKPPDAPVRHDLHTHSRVSDGHYEPADLVARAAAAGIRVLSLTDHDSTAGLTEAAAAARAHGLGFVPGVEISVSWRDQTVHVVGLGIDPDDAALAQGLLGLQATRAERAREMGRRLARAGIPGVHEEVAARAGGGMLTRTHFAQCLVRRGLAAEVRDVFNRYLVSGKPGHVPTRWAELATALGWIRDAGGVAVLAHPLRYRLSTPQRGRLCNEFREQGGLALEVLSGRAPPAEVQASAALALRHGLLASAGSDFHGPDSGWPRLGHLPALPAGLTPVWETWPAAPP